MGNQIQVPFSGQLQMPIQPGSSVVIGGRPHLNCQRFSVNLCANPVIEGQVQLHFNPRFDQGHVVCNSMKSGHWASEVITGCMPFKRNTNFEIQITAGKNGYQIFVNGSKFCQFPYRLPKENVQFLHIKGEVFISHIYYKEPPGKAPPNYYAAPQMMPPMNAPPMFNAAPPMMQYPHEAPPPYSRQGPIHNPTLPLSMLIPEGMSPNKIILISGTMKHKASRFSVYFINGPNESVNDVPFTFDVRFNYGKDVNVVVRNTKQGGRWGHEERELPSFPFRPGGKFELMILAEPTCFKVAVNQQHFVQYSHRVPLQHTTHLGITGDATLALVRFQ